MIKHCLAWELVPVIPALRKLRQQDHYCKLEESLGYRMNPASKEKKKKKPKIKIKYCLVDKQGCLKVTLPYYAATSSSEVYVYVLNMECYSDYRDKWGKKANWLIYIFGHMC